MVQASLDQLKVLRSYIFYLNKSNKAKDKDMYCD